MPLESSAVPIAEKDQVHAADRVSVVQRFGYRPLELVVAVSADVPPQVLRLEPDPVQLEGLTV